MDQVSRFPFIKEAAIFQLKKKAGQNQGKIKGFQ